MRESKTMSADQAAILAPANRLRVGAHTQQAVRAAVAAAIRAARTETAARVVVHIRGTARVHAELTQLRTECVLLVLQAMGVAAQ
mmetsp:Transcript_32698/g.54073  ORF Transcript_32698/g.54073 Transcript_32698/m.54073 type:complete len:85 (-) Transcript_32698:608-862(-)